GLAADGNGDRAVDDLDYEYWKSRFGASAGQGAGLSRPVPEPATLSLVGLATAAALCLRGLCRRRSQDAQLF
ncbi:MAG: PEP-CTERM sorting domain-containing protein, partial [Pirellulales bacterium]